MNKGKTIDDLKNIIRNVPNMSTCPEYTSGRGATLADLDSSKLLKIQEGIKKEFGDAASKAFVIMVDNIEVLSCTTFLNELYQLFYNDWKVKPLQTPDQPGYDIAKNKDGEYNLASGLMTIANMMGASSQRDDTFVIKEQFLRSNGVKLNYNEKSSEFAYGYKGFRN